MGRVAFNWLMKRETTSQVEVEAWTAAVSMSPIGRWVADSPCGSSCGAATAAS